MIQTGIDRRTFLMATAGSAASLAALSDPAWAAPPAGPAVASAEAEPQAAPTQPASPARLKFAVIGINHSHINSQIAATIAGGGELAWVFAKEPDLLAAFAKRFPQARVARSEAEVLEDPVVKLVLSASIPDERAALGIRVMRHGKDFMSDKPGVTSLEQLAEVRKVQAETKRIYSIMYSERHENRSTVRAGDLVKAGAIGRVISTTGVGPHRVGNVAGGVRPDWFWDTSRYGGILVDIASHQADQFLYFTGSTSASVVAARVANYTHPDAPTFEDYGDMMLKGDGGAGYVQVHWYTPDGLPTWGDGRLTIVGTEGYIELRKYVDIAGRPGGDHLFLVDRKGVQYIDCKNVPLPYGPRLVDDVLNRTETAMPQAHCFLAMELVLKAQQAVKAR